MSLAEVAPRETALEAGGVVKGVAIAIVTQNQDDEGQCRVKVSYPWHENPRDSYWARLATPMAGAGRGFVTIPEVGDEVVVAFEREDLRFPFVLGSLWNGQDAPPLSNDDGSNDRRVFESRKHHRLLYDDGERGVVELSHEGGRILTLDDDGIRLEDGSGNRIQIDSTSGAMTIEAVGRLEIKAATIAIESSGTLEIKAGATLTLRGTLVNIN
jgi:uncharacterized protein involved in type VI secretion and phage assembly